jgi:hypothetical protein
MASNYFANQNPNDIAIQSEDGGGIVLTNQGKFLFGAKLPDVNQQLNEDFYQGNVDINPNTNSSFIGIMNAKSAPVDVNIPSTNQYSLFTPPENTVVEPNPPKDDCANEFNDSSAVLLNWENDNTSKGNYKNITTAVYDGGWDPYGANGSGIKNGEINKAKKYLQDYFWNTNNKNTGDFSIAADAGTNKDNPKLLIKNLPPGLRVMAVQFNYNAKQWWTRILATVGEDWLNSGFGIPYRLTSNLGPTSSDSYEYLLKDGITKSGKYVYNSYKVAPDSNKEFALKGDKRIQLFIDQYDQIIDLYNQDKGKFLSTLKDETIRYYKALDQALTPNPSRLKFWLEYVERAYKLATKFKDCPADNQMSPTTVLPKPNQSTQSIPPPSPTPQVSLTADEVEEGIYIANFLPASESEGAQIFGYIIYEEFTPTTVSPSDLLEKGADIKLDDYTGPTKTTTNKGGKLVLNVGVLKGADGDVNQEVHLPSPFTKGKEIKDGYRGKLPVKQTTWNSSLVSYKEIIATFKRIGLTEDQARSCFAITGAESARVKQGYFAGYNWNIFGLQAEGKWRESVSKYISYRYIAQDSAKNVNTGENKSLRIFAGYENIDNAVASKAEAMSFKGLLDVSSADDWAKKYRCTWVASGCNDSSQLSNAAAIYKTWGIRIFNENKTGIY